MVSYTCHACEYQTSVKTNYDKHLTTIKHRQTIERTSKTVEDTAKIIEDQKKLLDEQKRIIDEYAQTNRDLTMKVSILEAQAIKLESLMDKVASRPITVNTTNNKTTNNVLQILSSEPIDYTKMRIDLPKIFTAEAITQGKEYFYGLINDVALTDSKGNPKAVCTDIARQNFQILDETTGKPVYDPKLKNTRTKINEVTKPLMRTLSADLLDRVETERSAYRGLPMGKIDAPTEVAAKLRETAKLKKGFSSYMAHKTYRGARIRFDDEA